MLRKHLGLIPVHFAGKLVIFARQLGGKAKGIASTAIPRQPFTSALGMPLGRTVYGESFTHVT